MFCSEQRCGIVVIVYIVIWFLICVPISLSKLSQCVCTWVSKRKSDAFYAFYLPCCLSSCCLCNPDNAPTNSPNSAQEVSVPLDQHHRIFFQEPSAAVSPVSQIYYNKLAFRINVCITCVTACILNLNLCMFEYIYMRMDHFDWLRNKVPQGLPNQSPIYII